jgi:hypothetical protein
LLVKRKKRSVKIAKRTAGKL